MGERRSSQRKDDDDRPNGPVGDAMSQTEAAGVWRTIHPVASPAEQDRNERGHALDCIITAVE